MCAALRVRQKNSLDTHFSHSPDNSFEMNFLQISVRECAKSFFLLFDDFTNCISNRLILDCSGIPNISETIYFRKRNFKTKAVGREIMHPMILKKLIRNTVGSHLER